LIYDLYDYGRMIADEIRINAYRAALKSCIHQNSVVLDIGTGTGIFSLLAAQFGAKRIYAIEPNNSINLAKSIAKDNGLEKKITFFQKSSLETELPEKVDIIVSDLREVLPICTSNIPLIIKARDKFLKNNGILLPAKDIIYGSLVFDERLYNKIVHPWESQKFNLDMKAARRQAVNNPRSAIILPPQLLATPFQLTTITYKEISSPNINSLLKFKLKKKQKAHGLGLWFETTIYKKIGFSTSPNAPQTIYQQMFFPFPHPIDLLPFDTVTITMSVTYSEERYTWYWHTTLQRNKSKNNPILSFNQSALQS
jgi:SAM-dependent methyltransferase